MFLLRECNDYECVRAGREVRVVISDLINRNCFCKFLNVDVAGRGEGGNKIGKREN